MTGLVLFGLLAISIIVTIIEVLTWTKRQFFD